MTIITIISIFEKETTVFYILYLFWCDELIRTLSDGCNYIFRKKSIQNSIKYISNVKSRFFLLFVYLVFLIVVFGLMMDWKNSDLIIHNLSVLFLKNTFFNFTIITFVLREIYFFMHNKTQLEAKSLFSSGIIILHISIVLGILFWAISTQKVEIFKEYATIISIVPFLILKLFFEIKTVNN